MRCAKISSILAAVLVGMLAAGSQAAVTPPNDKDFSKGDWELNVAKSTFACNKAPQVSKRHIIDAGWGMTFVEWTGTQADGKPFITHYVFRYDGQKYPVGIDRPDAKEAIIYTLKTPHHIDFVHVDKDGKVTSTYYRDISADGQTMTQSSKFTGKSCEDLQVFERR
jgi:hypothetical protein